MNYTIPPADTNNPYSVGAATLRPELEAPKFIRLNGEDRVFRMCDDLSFDS